MTALFDRVALIGVGLIGSSLSHAMRSAWACGACLGACAERRHARQGEGPGPRDTACMILRLLRLWMRTW